MKAKQIKPLETRQPSNMPDAAQVRIAELEEQLREARKLAGIGKLAAGVAHDFNNVLTAILGHVEIALEVSKNESVREDLHCIREVARSSADLADQLLNLSRGGREHAPVATVDTVLQDLHRILKRALGGSIRVVCQLDASGVDVGLSKGQLEQLVLNLALNARDAMPEGGTLSLETAVAAGPNGTPGVRLLVVDDGAGITPADMERVFEPWYTTKGANRGTGLGLSGVRKAVQDVGGTIVLRSTVGEGTRAEIFLPRAGLKQDDEASAEIHVQTVLLVEDDPQVRRLLGRILQRSGYHVLSAASGSEALEACSQTGNSIDLLLTDVVMPGMGGAELADRVMDVAGNVSVLFVSGYTGDAIKDLALGQQSRVLLNKPFSSEQLLNAVSGLLVG